MRFLVIALLLINVLACANDPETILSPDATTESCFVFDDAGIGRPRCVQGFERDD